MALANGVEPQAFVLANLLARFQFQHVAGILAQIPPDVIIILNLAQEADALRILALGIHQVFALRNLPHLVLHVMSDGEQSLAKLPVVYLRQEIRLVLHGVGTRGEPFLPVYPFRLRIMARGNEVVVVPHLLVEGPELNQSIAHHVGIRRESCPHLVHRVPCHLTPVFLMAIYHLQPAAKAMSHSRCHLQILLRRAVPFLLFLRSNLDIETVGMQSAAGQFIDHHRTIHAAREQHRYSLVLKFFVFHVGKVNHIFRKCKYILSLFMVIPSFFISLQKCSEWEEICFN